MKTTIVAQTIIIVFFCIVNYKVICTSKLLRNKRFLIFPRQAPTRHQFIGGIGIPVDLTYESLTIGYVLKAEFWLPFNETVFRENPYFPEYKNDKLYNNVKIQQDPNFVNARSFKREVKKSKLRWDIYDIIIHRLNGLGYKGQECLLRAICEANALQFMRHFDVYGELLHIFFSPSTSSDLKSAESQNFLQAEKLGRSGDSCSIYDCNLSILDIFSKVLKVG
ncbi:uncharacterized protein LOC111687650 [Lucilia cuprina]|uniref:uncharacterized protein LOC111687650 n=1 Tax=Lucilia cuprina TaxID=7375 RepID=UPI001F0602B4|nr:uncharacterized protein LOC111687650 [Lucilia cuprina]